MATNTDALLAPARPHPAVFLAHDISFCVQEFKLQWTVARRLHKERAILLDGGGSQDSNSATYIEGGNSDNTQSSLRNFAVP